MHVHAVDRGQSIEGRSRVHSLRALLVITLLVGLSGSMAWAASAHAQLPIVSFDGSAETNGATVTQAGSHPDVTTSFFFPFNADRKGIPGPIEDPKDVTVDLPPGLVGNPTATTQCSPTDIALGRSTCPITSQVGIVGITTSLFTSTPIVLYEPVYNLVPPTGVPAEFGFNISGVVIRLNARVRTGTDNGLSIDITDISQAVGVIGTSLTLWGVPADPSHDDIRGSCLDGTAGTSLGICPTPASPEPFITLPTNCAAGPVVTTLTVNSWQDPTHPSTASFVSHDSAGNAVGVNGCDRLGFDPSLTVRPDRAAAGSPAGFGIDLKVPLNENPTGLAVSNLKKVVVTLPLGVAVSPSSADGLQGCAPSEIHLNDVSAPTCPNGSKIGDLSITTPLLSTPLTGGVFLASPNDNPFGSLLAIYLVASGDGVTLKLPGQIQANPQTGQLTATFDNNPELPFSDLSVNFKGGPRAPLVDTPVCGTATTSSQLTGWNGAVQNTTDSYVVSQDGQGAPCTGGGFDPWFTAGTVNPAGGQNSPFTLTFGRADADQALGTIAVNLPKGLLGKIASVPLCPDAAAVSGGCTSVSQIGTATTAAGAGTSPLQLPGRVYLTGPYRGGPFGLSIVVPAIAGPFNLGTVVVRAAIYVDPTTAALTITSDRLPTILQGIPLQIRAVNVTVDREGFTFNPTNCEAQTVGATISSAQGARAAVSSHFQAANCATLPFKPNLSASTGGRASKAGGASLDVKVSSKGGPQPGGGEANIRSVKVDLPTQLPSRLTTLQKACPDSVFQANPASCPAASNVGTGGASTPVLAHPLSGPAYLVSHGGAAFPDLEIVLQGEGITLVLDGKTDIKKGITMSTFSAVPDAPISSFELKLPTGKYSVFAVNLPAAANYDFCGKTLVMPTRITGQNGAVVKQSTKIGVSGCPRAKKSHAKKTTHARKATHGHDKRVGN